MHFASHRLHFFLPRQERCQIGQAPCHQLRDPAERKAEAFECDHLVQTGNLFGALDTPSRGGSRRPDQPMRFVHAQGLAADA